MVDANKVDYMLDPPDDPPECPECDAWMDVTIDAKIRGRRTATCDNCGYKETYDERTTVGRPKGTHRGRAQVQEWDYFNERN